MDTATRGWLNGLLGVVIFSGSLPATRVAVRELDPLFVTAARAGIAGLVALIALLTVRAPRPRGGEWRALVIVALGVVVGFPLLSAFALRYNSAARSLVFMGLLPIATALFGVLRDGERPRAPFWLFAAAGSALIAGFALHREHSAVAAGDGLMVVAVGVCGLGYAEGGRLARRLGGWQVISWALVLALPAMAPVALLAPPAWGTVSGEAWIGLAYVSLFSMLIGFVFWYRGLAQGGIAAVGQLQLVQPFLGLGVAAALLREPVSRGLLATSVCVALCVAGARRFARR